MDPLLRNTWVEIDLDQLARNVQALQDFVGAGVQIAPVVKGDAYGHGAVPIAEELARLDVAYIAVAILSEAIELRNHDIRTPMLVMGYTENELLPLAVQNDVTVTIFEEEQAGILSRAARDQNRITRAHIKVDTGFHRLGNEPSDEFVDEILRMSRLPNLVLDGVFSHLRLADDEDDRKQYNSFTSFLMQLERKGLHFPHRHISDSIAAVEYPDFALTMIRPGAVIYGYVPKYQLGRIDVKPVMTFKTKITRIQHLKKGEAVGYDEDFRTADDTVLATVPVGYADGYSRALSRIGEVLIRGKRARVIGTVCMDQMAVDVSSIEGVAVGDEAILFGPQPGAPSVEELSSLMKTNKNSVVAAISRRVPRVYRKNGAVCRILDYLTQK